MLKYLHNIMKKILLTIALLLLFSGCTAQNEKNIGDGFNSLQDSPTLESLTDVDLYGLATDDYLQYDGTDWVPVVGTGGGGGGATDQLGQIGDVSTSTPMTYGEMLRYNTATSEWESVATSTLGLSSGGSGTVTSVDLSVPTGLAIADNPITTSGTLALDYDGGYAAVRTASTTNWNDFYDTPSSRITDGTNLAWAGNTLNVDDPFTVATLVASTVASSTRLQVGGTSESGFSGNGDIFASDSIRAVGGFYADAKPYGAGLEILNAGNTITYTNIANGDATLTASSQIITDTHASFDSSYEGQFLRVISSAAPSFGGATGEVQEVLDSTHLVVSFGTANGDAIPDATAMSFIIYPAPIFFVGDNGDFELTVGNNEDAVFEIEIPEGNGFTGVYIDDIAGADQHQALTIDVDSQGYDGIVALNLFMQNASSTNPSDGVLETMASLEGNANNYLNSSLRFMDFNLIGTGTDNDVDIMHINNLPLTSHIIHSGNPNDLERAYYDDGDGTTIDSTTAFNSAGTNITLFENDNSIIYIAGATGIEFTNIAFDISTESQRTINAEYYYCDGDDSWKVLSGVVSTINGFKQSGSINFMNPVDRGQCNEEIDSTAFADTDARSYIAIKRTRSNNWAGQKPIENLVSISGGGTYLYMDSYGVKPVGSAGAPYSCTASEAGMTYYDTIATSLLWCTGSAWIAFAEVSDITVHNNLSGIQGGTSAEYYHLTSAEYTELQLGYLLPTDINTYDKLNTIVADATLVYTGGAFHDGFSDFVANEHLDWTSDQGATNIDAGNYIDTTYTAGGTLLDLTTGTFSLDEGTLTDTKVCTYEAGTGIECNTTVSSSVLAKGNFIVGDPSNETSATSTIYLTEDGRIGIGTEDPASINSSAGFLLATEDGNKSDFGNYVAGAGYPAFILLSSNGTIDSPTIVTNPEVIGAFDWKAYDGVDFNTVAARIRAETSGSIAENLVTTSLVFQTNDGISGNATELIIDSNGLLTFSNATSTVGITAPTFYGALQGNALTSTAFAANPAGHCAAGEYGLGIDANGEMENCTDATTEINSVVNGLGGTNLTCAAQNCNVDDFALKNDATDIGVGLTLTGDNSSADTNYVPNILYNTDDTPPAASGFPRGTLYIQYTP